ncbi:protein arginine N-methyltransferase 5-like [Histomonas meleagridis]|nr:protein arginine N-methyltransferase 5-like [Histomonas meleagridis]
MSTHTKKPNVPSEEELNLADLKIVPETGATILHHWASTNDLDPLIIVLAKAGEKAMLITDYFGNTVLHYAAWASAREVTQFVVNHFPKTHFQNIKKITPAHIAAQRGDVNLLRLYQTSLKIFHDYSTQGWSALHFAIYYGQIDAVRFLLENKINSVDDLILGAESNVFLNHRRLKFTSPYDLAIISGHNEIAELLVQYGALPSLHSAVLSQNLLAVTYLVESHQSTASKNLNLTAGPKNYTALHVAASKGYYSICHYLILSGLSTNALDSDGLSPLEVAVTSKSAKTVETIQTFASEEQTTKAAFLAADLGNNQITFNLVKRVTSPSYSDEDGDNLLIHLIKRNMFEEALLLVQSQKCDIKHKDSRGATALHYSAASGHILLLKEVLSQSKLLINEKDNNGMIPLMYAVLSGNTESINILKHSDNDLACNCGTRHPKIYMLTLPKVYVIYDDINDYIQNYSIFQHKKIFFGPVFKYQNILKNLNCEFLRYCSRLEGSAIIVDLNNKESIQLSDYLRFSIRLFTLDKFNVNKFADILKPRLSDKEIIYCAICDDYSLYIELANLCDNVTNLGICPSTFNPIWRTVNSPYFVINSKNVFSSDLSIKLSCEYELLSHMYLNTSFIFTFQFPISNEDLQLYHHFCDLFLKNPPNPYLTKLQCFLQPLQQQLTSTHYESFESDKIKYSLYKTAISKSLHKFDHSPLIAIVGAGRGPIVDSALSAGAKHIIAIEKNPIAARLLQLRKEQEWPETVEVIEGDMRTVNVDKKVEILVSELLGGFGDNELSPECLIGCERFLSPNAISIPMKYTSFLVPLMSNFMWSYAKSEKMFDQMCIIPLSKCIFLSECKKCFEFHHPNCGELYMKKVIEFCVNYEGMLCGFGGWFEAELFDDVKISISPLEDEANGFSSWYPIYLPLHEQIKVFPDDVIKLEIERKGNEDYVWYEWKLLEPKELEIQNKDGSTFKMGLHVEE